MNPKHLFKTALITGLTIAGLAGPALSAPSVDEIVKKTNEASYYQGEDGRAAVKMTITDAQGRTRSRAFTVMRRDEADGGEQKFYIYFSAPADVARMAFIVHKHLDRDDDRWLYLPAMDLVKRIAASDKRTSFVGSDFFYEDVSGRRLADDEHTLVKDSGPYYVLKHTPKDKGSVEFDHYVMYVHKKTFLPTKVEYFDSKGALYRTMTVNAVKTVQGHPTVTKATMEDLRAKTKTVLEYSDVAYDLGLPDRVFKERSLRRAPRKYLGGQ